MTLPRLLANSAVAIVVLGAVARPLPANAQRCHPSYEGACVPADVDDVDCEGGNGNGPYYVRGPIYIVGPDEYELDRDGDGVACEPEKNRRR